MAIIQKNLVGIEIGTKNIKMVKVNSRGKITNQTYVDMPEKIIANGRVESKQMLIETLKIAKRKLGTSFSDCALCFSSPEIVIRHITIPQMEDSYIEKNIMLELSGFLPTNPELYVIDYIFIDSIVSEDKKAYQYLVYAIPAEIVKSYLFCLKSAGFKVKFVDVVENAYSKFYKMQKQNLVINDDSFACLYIDNSKASISVYGNGKFFINKNIDAGVSKICEDIAAKTGKNVEVVNKLIYTIDLYGPAEMYATEKNMIQEYIKEVSFEANRVIDYFKSQNKEKTIGTVYFSGGFTQVKGVQSYFEEILGIPVVISSKFTDSMFLDLPAKNNGVDYTNAIAITFREEKTK
ncbi:MAG: pilus assembly protein PilM [Saccharofermentanales bacterium]